MYKTEKGERMKKNDDTFIAMVACIGALSFFLLYYVCLNAI